MQQNLVVVLALLASQLNALPLNINLGAYSPALVVGDGEISFGGKQDVSNLMNALEGAAVSGAAAAAAAPPATGAGTAAAAGAAAPITAASVQPATQAAPPQGQVLPAGSTLDTTQVTSLQGMGKEIAPRVVPLVKSRLVLSPENAKRDIAGFNAALNYATGALKTSPEVQLGTGEGGSGVGITQKAGGVTSTPAKAGKRGVTQVDVEGRDVSEKKLKTVVTTMFVRGGPASLERSEDSNASSPIEKRAPAPVPAPAPASGTIDGVNLNMAEGQVAELTFVETRAVEDDEE